MYVIQITLLVIGIALLIGGYRKNNRNILFAAAVILFASVAIVGFVNGFKDGFSGTQNSQSLINPAQQPNNSFKPTPLRGAA